MKKQEIFENIIRIVEEDDREAFDKFLNSKTRRSHLAMPYLGYGTYYDQEFVGVSNTFLRDILDKGTESQTIMLRELEERCPTSVMIKSEPEEFSDSWFNYLCFLYSIRYKKGSYKEYKKGLFNGGYDDFLFDKITGLWINFRNYIYYMNRYQLQILNDIVLREGSYKFSAICDCNTPFISFLANRFPCGIDIEILEELCDSNLVSYPNKILTCLLGFLRGDSFRDIVESNIIPKELLSTAFYFIHELERVDLIKDKFPKWFNKEFVKSFMGYLLPEYDRIDYWDVILDKSEKYKKGDKTWSGDTELDEYWNQYFCNNYSYYRDLDKCDSISQKRAGEIYNISFYSYIGLRHTLKKDSNGYYTGSVWYKDREIPVLN